MILRPARDGPALRELVDDIVPELVAAGVIHAATGSGTLRERLSLPAAAPRVTAGGRPFPHRNPKTSEPDVLPEIQDLHSERVAVLLFVPVPAAVAQASMYRFKTRCSDQLAH